jgi:flagellar biosynthesis protein FlhF
MLGAELLRSEPQLSVGGGAALYGWLVGRGLAQEIALSVVKDLGGLGAGPFDVPDLDPEARKRLLEALSGYFKTGGFEVPSPRKGGRPEVIALVGPTGVGKTTTVAKLAARLALRERLKVGLVSCDGYRLGAPDQAKSFARVLGLPIELCGSERELRSALSAHRDRDVVLVDTAGRSPHDSERLAEISALVEVRAHCHLVLSATKRDEELAAARERFGAAVPCESLIFTKLDEAERLGAVLNTAHRSGLPISWLGTGQCIPDDLERATAAVVAGLLLKPWGRDLEEPAGAR